MNVHINPSSSEAIYVQLTNQIIADMDSGRMPPGERLEPEVELAARLGVSRMTINKTYHELALRGYIERFRSRGTFVRARNHGDKIKGTLTILGAGLKAKPSPISMDYFHGFQEAASKAGYATRIEFFPGGSADWRPHMAGSGIAFLLSTLPAGPLPEAPAVFLMGWTTEPCPLDWIHTDSLGGGKLAAEHFLKSGHKRLACYMDYIYHAGILQRVEGFYRTLANAGIEFLPGAIPSSDKPSTPEHLISLLRHPDRPTAVFCTSDSAALRVMDIARDLGFSIPADLSVIGFDKSFLCDLSRIPLTTIACDRNLTGQKAALALIERVEGRYKGPPREIITPVSLWQGASTAARTELIQS